MNKSEDSPTNILFTLTQCHDPRQVSYRRTITSKRRSPERLGHCFIPISSIINNPGFKDIINTLFPGLTPSMVQGVTNQVEDWAVKDGVLGLEGLITNRLHQMAFCQARRGLARAHPGPREEAGNSPACTPACEEFFVE